MRRGAWVLGLALCACKAGPPPAGQGGAVFRATPSARPTVGARALMDVCWPRDAVARPGERRVTLDFVLADGRLADLMFETAGGASASVGRCMREVAWVYPWGPGERPSRLEVLPPDRPASGWAALAYVRLLSEGLYPDDRGLLDAAPGVRACLARGLGVRPGVRFVVAASPVQVMVEGGGEPAPVTDSERCVVAVLGATQYPGTRGYALDFSSLEGAPAPADASSVSVYFAEALPAAIGAIDPARAREALALRGPAVAACWEAALGRRAGLAGRRSMRIRVGPSGRVESAQVVGNQSDAGGEAADLLLDQCLARAVAGAKFEGVTGGSAELVYSWVFARR